MATRRKTRKQATFPRAQRKRPLVTYSQSVEAVAVVKELAERLGVSRSAVVELAIRSLALQHGLGLEEMRRLAQG